MFNLIIANFQTKIVYRYAKCKNNALERFKMRFIISQNKSDIEIAEILEVSENTISSYRKKIKDKGFNFDADAVI